MIRARTLRTLSPVTVLAAAACAALTLVPLGYLLSETLVVDGRLTFEAFEDAYGVAGFGTLAWNSTLFAVGSTALALAVGTLQAVLVVRTDVPGRRLILAGALAPLFLPGLLYTIGWVLLASPRSGILNAALPVTLDVFGMGGMIVAEGLHSAPLVFLIVAAALAAQDAAHEEAAAMAGAPPATILRRITLPLLTPALAGAGLLCAVRAIEGFEVPALLGSPGGRPVFTSRIFDAMNVFPADVAAAGAAALTLLAITAAAAVLVARVGRGGRRFELGGGARRRPARLALGPLRAPAAAAGLLCGLIAGALPIAALLYSSLQPFYAPPSAESLERITLEPYRDALGGPSLEALWTSFWLAAVATTAIVALTAVCAWIVVRTRLRGRAALDAVTSLPLALPGLVVGLALLMFSTSVTAVYGTLLLLIIAYCIRFQPYGMRFAAASMHRVGADQEDAARVAGAGWGTSFRRIILPLVLPGLAAGWLYVMALSMRELSSVVLIVPPGTELFSTRVFAQYQNGDFSALSALGLTVAALLSLATAAAWRLGRRSLA